MDVERIQRVNELARNLLSQGLAKDRDDAVAQAEKVFPGEDSGSYTEMQESVQVKKQEQKSEQSPLSEDNIKVILKKNTEYLVKTIKEFQERIDNLEKELTGVKTKLSVHKIPSVKELVMNSQEQSKKPAEQKEKPKKRSSS